MALAREGSEEAVVLARAAIASGWLSPYARGYAGSLLARHYRCDEASDVLDGLDASVELDAETDEMVLDARSRIVDCVQAELKHAEELEALEDLEVPEE
jgi:hypothetical protein